MNCEEAGEISRVYPRTSPSQALVDILFSKAVGDNDPSPTSGKHWRPACPVFENVQVGTPPPRASVKASFMKMCLEPCLRKEQKKGTRGVCGEIVGGNSSCASLTVSDTQLAWEAADPTCCER